MSDSRNLTQMFYDEFNESSEDSLETISNESPIVMSEKDFSIYLRGYLCNPQYTLINLKDFLLTEPLQILLKAFISKTTVTEIGLGHNEMTLGQFSSLLQQIAERSTIRKLTLYNTTKSELYILSEFIKNNKTLTCLALNEFYVQPHDFNLFLKRLSANQSISSLSFKNVHFNANHLIYLCRFLKTNKKLTEFSLNKNNFDLDASTPFLLMIFNALCVNRTLKSLSLINLNLKEKTCYQSELLNFFIINNTITKLVLDDNNLGDAGILHLTQAINGNSQSALTKISLMNNKISIKSYKALAEMIQSNCIITSLACERPEEYDKQILSEIDSIEKTIIDEEDSNQAAFQFGINDKKNKIELELEHLQTLDQLLSDPGFNQKVGYHQGIDRIKEIIHESTIPILKKWPLMQEEIKNNRKGFRSQYFPLFLWGRDTLTNNLYTFIEDRNFVAIKDLKDDIHTLDKKINKDNRSSIM